MRGTSISIVRGGAEISATAEYCQFAVPALARICAHPGECDPKRDVAVMNVGFLLRGHSNSQPRRATAFRSA